MGFEIGKTVAGYEIVEVLGTSKTGVAYKVRNIFAQRFEVLKILPKSFQDDDEQNARFLREIKVHAQLLHPNIVTFYNAREIEGQLVMTKEFVPGVTLAVKLQAGGITWREASRYACHALSALEYAHAHGIVHRGLSSSNLIITDEGIARLNGFGFAKSVTDPELTAAGVVIGTLKYMSPEQVKGDVADARSDIYSLGIVLYEMLVGKVPFEAKSQFEIMMAQVNAPPKHASDVNLSVPRELSDVVAKALAKPPDERFQNAREFRTAIERIELSQLAPVLESKSPSLAAEEVPEPLAGPAPLSETAAPTPLPPLPDAWAIGSALETAESKLATTEVTLSQPVAESQAAVETSASSPSGSFSDLWRMRFQPESTPKPAAVEIAELSESPFKSSLSSLPDAPASELVLDSTGSGQKEPKLDSSWPLGETNFEVPLEPVQSVIEEAAPTETPAIATSGTLSDALAIESTVVSAESRSAPEELMSQPEPEPQAIPAPPAEPPAPLTDWWTLNSQLTPAESTPAPAEFAAPPAEFEPSTLMMSTLAIAGDPVAPSPSAPPDLWAAEWTPAAAESKPGATQLDLLSNALEAPKSEVNLTSTLTSLPDLWVTEPSVTSTESKHEATGLSSSSFALEHAHATDQHQDLAETPLSLWTSGPPDTWVWEPASASKFEPAPQPALSEPVVPLAHPLESAALAETPAAPPAPPQQSQAIEATSEVVEPAPEPALEAPQVAAAAAAASTPAPVARTPAQVNPDLLTALFGDTLLSRLSLTLVVCAITFFLGTVTLFAVLSVTKP